MQIILTYIIVAAALLFVGRGIYRLFRSARKGGSCGDCCSCANSAKNKKPFVFGNSPVKKAGEQKEKRK